MARIFHPAGFIAGKTWLRHICPGVHTFNFAKKEVGVPELHHGHSWDPLRTKSAEEHKEESTTDISDPCLATSWNIDVKHDPQAEKLGEKTAPQQGCCSSPIN